MVWGSTHPSQVTTWVSQGPPGYCLFLCRHALVWRLLHMVLFVTLYFQSERQSWTKTYEQYGWSKREAFDGWKRSVPKSALCHCVD